MFLKQEQLVFIYLHLKRFNTAKKQLKILKIYFFKYIFNFYLFVFKDGHYLLWRSISRPLAYKVNTLTARPASLYIRMGQKRVHEINLRYCDINKFFSACCLVGSDFGLVLLRTYKIQRCNTSSRCSKLQSEIAFKLRIFS